MKNYNQVWVGPQTGVGGIYSSMIDEYLRHRREPCDYTLIKSRTPQQCCVPEPRESVAACARAYTYRSGSTAGKTEKNLVPGTETAKRNRARNSAEDRSTRCTYFARRSTKKKLLHKRQTLPASDNTRWAPLPR